jgi:UDP-4-amino-4,6-dideoxy-N-acetyl-beta-L-altrosamine N-acetyltransferase
MILDWRNIDNIRKCMYSQDEISIEGHVNFIGDLLFSKDRQYMVVKRDGNYLGVVYFDKIDFDRKQCYFGLYANPSNKKGGAGNILQEVGVKYIFDLLKLKKIKLEVFKINIRAINLYKKSNFVKTNEKTVNERRVNCMELKR